MSHIFISYHQGDADFAAVMSIHIEKASFDTWMDKNRLRPGQDWSVEIDEAIINAHALIVIMSPEAKASEYVTYEWSFALGAGVPVIPVMYKDTTLHPRLARLQHLKFTDTTVRPWDVLMDTVKEAVNNSAMYVVRIPRDAPPHVKRAIISLDSAHDAERDGAIRVLAQADHPAAREALLHALQHPLASVRWYAALHVSEDSRAIPVLVDAFLNDSRSSVGPMTEIKRRYANHLATFGADGMDALLGLLVNHRLHHRSVIEGLSRYTSGEPVPRLVEALRSSEAKLRLSAVRALAHQPLELTEGELIRALSDDDQRVAVEAVTSLAASSRPGQRKTSWAGLMEALRHTSNIIRDAAASKFRLVPPNNVQQELFELVRKGPLVTALAALRALMRTDIDKDVLIGQGVLEKLESRADLPPGTILVLKSDARRATEFAAIPLYVLTGRHSDMLLAYRIIEEDTRIVVDRQDMAPAFTLDFFVTGLRLELNTTQ